MTYIHKIGVISFFKNGVSKSNVITFESDCCIFREAALSIINHHPEFHDCFIYEPVTLSPVTFDLTVNIKPGEHLVKCDRFFMTFNELKKFCDNENNYLSVVTHPFCRVIFSKAGRLGEFLEFHGKVKNHFKELKGSIYNNPIKFDDIDINVISDIRNGIYKHSI